MQKENINHASFEVKLCDFKQIKNSGFIKGKCRVAYAGENRNYTRIFKEAFDKAEETIYNIPVVGNWIEAKDNFGGHDIVLETEGNDLKFKSKTIPYGVVPESCNPRWEEVTDEYGNVKNYFTVDVILWKERYPQQIEKVENDGVNQSMEIMVTDGEWDEHDDYFNINDFYFSALCLLGRERNEQGDKGQDDVEPCFENAEVTTYSFNKEDFQKEFNLMLNEINKITKSAIKGGEEMEKDTKASETIKKDTKEFVEETKPTSKETKVEKNTKTQTEEEMSELKQPETKVENIEKVIENNSLETKTTEITKDEKDNKEKTSNEDFKLKYEELSIQFSQLQIFKNELEQKFNSLKTEVESLREYKNNIENKELRQEKEQIFNDYSLILDENEMKEIKDSVDNYSIEEIQKKLAIVYSIKSINNVKQEQTKKDTVIAVENLKSVEKTDNEIDKFAVK